MRHQLLTHREDTRKIRTKYIQNRHAYADNLYIKFYPQNAYKMMLTICMKIFHTKCIQNYYSNKIAKNC